jgi:YARHG domain
VGLARDVRRLHVALPFVVVIAGACKGGAATSGAAAGSAGSGAAAASAGGAAAGSAGPGGGLLSSALAGGGSAAGARDARCHDACRFLAEWALADAPARFRATCGVSWPYAETDCDAQLFQVNCIYATHGYTFKHPEWKVRFEHLAWYHPRADFTERELSAQENASIHELKQRERACHAAAEPVGEADRKLVAQTFQRLDNEDAGGIPGVFTPDERIRNLYVDDKTTLRYAAKTATQRTITVEHLFHAVGGGERVDLSVDLTFDAHDQLLDVAF